MDPCVQDERERLYFFVPEIFASFHGCRLIAHDDVVCLSSVLAETKRNHLFVCLRITSTGGFGL